MGNEGLERILSNLISLPDNDGETISSNYFLPIDISENREDTLYALLRNPDQAVDAVPIGVQRSQKLLFTDTYEMRYGRMHLMDRPRAGVGYIPLEPTRFVWRTTKEQESYRMLGTRGASGLQPLVLYGIQDGELQSWGFIDHKGKVATIRHPVEGQTRSVLADIYTILKERQHHLQLEPPAPEPSAVDWQEPKSIVDFLDGYVIGQDEAKRVAAVAFSNYAAMREQGIGGVPKDNLLLIGPTGSGKTYMVELLAAELDVPFVKTALGSHSAEGYVGPSLSRTFHELRQMTADDPEPYGVVFLDEIDKLVQHGNNGWGDSIMSALLGWLERGTVDTGHKDEFPISTDNLLFVAAGAFHGEAGKSLDDIIADRVGGGKRLGFHAQPPVPSDSPDRRATQDDLVEYGLDRQLVGRLPSIARLHPLSIAHKRRILLESRGSNLVKYERILAARGYGLVVAPEAADAVVSRTSEETGARSLNSICSDLFFEILYDPARFADAEGVIAVDGPLAQRLLDREESASESEPEASEVLPIGPGDEDSIAMAS